MNEWEERYIPKHSKPTGDIWGTGRWIIKRKGYSHTTVACSECGKRFSIPNYCFKSERMRWKCCPICCAMMEGVDDD
jgi:hypothetical protein